MKLNKLFGLLAGASLLAFSACEPIEDRDVLKNSFDADNIELAVVQATNGGNKLSIQMNTPGVTGYWDYILDTKSTDRVEVVFPFTGTHEFTYYATTPYMTNDTPDTKEYIQKSVTVEVTQLDEPLPEAYYALVGDDLGGKTWVFDKDYQWSDGQNLFWAMVAPYNWQELWWNAGSTCCPPGDADGKMVFDLAGAPNYTYFTSPDDAGSLGSFAFNGDFTSITFNEQSILGYDPARVNPDSKYEIIELSSDRMILYTASNAGGTGWLWVFKPAE
ncbi:hypothetical protein KEM09_08415 [Carboxylicivirga mesophila]|uniref:Lipoprotein n=2 Tax=Carboxylicivirga TaxID=1628153 RepID=A0A941F827_9BACT|nr:MULTISPECIES: hypothetical protein [Carboxylicivirga]MBR8536975.1 hypothetical protein [Carboxylicivirga sediminis]MBS2211421.1 hypothetical protein [Carboxylicivirga mesophila]